MHALRPRKHCCLLFGTSSPHPTLPPAGDSWKHLFFCSFIYSRIHLPCSFASWCASMSINPLHPMRYVTLTVLLAILVCTTRVFYCSASLESYNSESGEVLIPIHISFLKVSLTHFARIAREQPPSHIVPQEVTHAPSKHSLYWSFLLKLPSWKLPLFGEFSHESTFTKFQRRMLARWWRIFHVYSFPASIAFIYDALTIFRSVFASTWALEMELSWGIHY